MSKRLRTILSVTLGVVIALSLAKPALADNTNNLIISQAKVTTSGQFVTLYNNTTQTINMSAVKLEYFNSYDASLASSGKVVALSGNLPSHGYFIVSDDVQPLCYQAVVQSASLGFSSTAGLVRVLNFSNSPIGLVEDQVGWVNKNPLAGVQTMPATPAFLQRQAANGVPVVSGTWQAVQPSVSDPCALVTFVTPSTPVNTPLGKLLPAIQPPATIVSLVSSSSGGTSGLPPSDVGLMVPELTELLPNPASPQSDSEDEFVEIYNPNSAVFDLTGFKLQTGTTTKHTYTFPTGTTIAAKAFAAYPSSNISISLTNSGGQVWLLDPDGNVIGQTDAYTNAQDGQAWALANGKWYWTTTPTPSAANIITGNSGVGSNKSGNGVGTVLGTSTTTGGNSTNNSANGTNQPAPIHSSVLVGVGALALLYGVYEYRHDIANWLYKLKRYRTARRETRAKA